MNVTFWVLMIVLLLLAIGMLVYPILKVRQASALAYKESNLKINEEKIKELDLDLKEGRIDQEYYKAAREELDRELLIDIPAVSNETAALHYAGTAKRHPALALMIAVFVPMVALLLYLDLGMHSASDEAFVVSQKLPQQQATSQPSVEEMTKRLEAKLEKEGGTVNEWTMLGRAHKYSGNYELAAKAFAVALEKDVNNAQLMLERAEVLALANNRVFTAEARDLVLKAAELEPDNPNTLWFIGVAEYQHENFRQAIDHLLRLLPQAAGEEEVMKSIVGIVSESRKKLVAAGEEMPELKELLGIKALATENSEQAAANKAPAATGAAASPAADVTSLQVAIDVDDDVRRKFNENDIVFVYAKAKQGPRMPLAVQRITLGSLPAKVVLDDSMAMVEGMNISAFQQLQVSARVTKTASAIAKSGDFIGQIDVDSKNAGSALHIVIDTMVP